MPHSRPAPRPQIGQSILDLSTPLPLIDEVKLAANIARVQAYMDRYGLAFRPHIKTHKIPSIAAQQVAAGAKGINCQKVTEAEVFADAGFEDLLITFNILGPEKLDRLVALNERIGGLKVVADSDTTITGLTKAFADKKPLSVLVECDTGGGRCGVQTPEQAFALADQILAAPGLAFGGILTYPKANSEAAVEAFFSQTIALLSARGIACPIVSNGGTPACFPPTTCRPPPSTAPAPMSTTTALWHAPATAASMTAPCTSWRPWFRARRRTVPSSMRVQRR